MEAYPPMRMVVILFLVGMVVALDQIMLRAVLLAAAIKLKIRMDPALVVELKLA
jgi:hypothetical protein